MAITMIKDIQAFKHSFNVRVRASLMWRPKKFNSDLFDGLHYRLVDQNGDEIHGIIDENHFPHMPHIMEEGEIYDIFKFSARKDYAKYRVAGPEAALYFTEKTEFIKVEMEIPLFPKYSFRLLEFHALAGEYEQQTILTDVYGCVKSIKPAHETPVKNKKSTETKLEITIENLRREVLKITLWGDMARNFNVASMFSLPPLALALFTGLRLNKYQDRISAYNSSHTCVVFNAITPQTKDYEAEFSKLGDQVKLYGTASYNQTNGEVTGDKKSVSELNTLDPQEYNSKTVFCFAGIVRFPQNNGWWYRSCSVQNCYKQLLKQEEAKGYYSCTLHGLQKPRPSYRVCMIIEDKDDQAKVTLMGKQAEEFFGATCEDLLGRRSYPTEQTLAPEIEEKLGEAYLFEIKVNFKSDLVVRNILGNPAPFDHPNVLTPAQLPHEKKRPNESCARSLFLLESEKKSKRQPNDEESSFAASPAMQELEKVYKKLDDEISSSAAPPTAKQEEEKVYKKPGIGESSSASPVKQDQKKKKKKKD